MMNILVTTSSYGKFDPFPLQYLQGYGLNVILNPFGRKLTEDEAIELFKVHIPVGLLAGVEPITEKVLDAAVSLRAIARAGIGMDSVDLDAAEKKNITVTNTPDAPTIPVAELTLGMILGLLRKIHVSDASIRDKRWERPMGHLLYEKTVGIIGCGRIGTRLSKILNGFECSLLGCDPACATDIDMELVDLDYLLINSDIVTLHLPYSERTHHLINEDRLDSMKKGAFLVNASRGGLVDEEALYHCLHNGHIAGAALDCFEEEPYTGPLQSLDNTLLTAHIGSYAKEGRVMMEMQAAKNLISQLKDQEVL